MIDDITPPERLRRPKSKYTKPLGSIALPAVDKQAKPEEPAEAEKDFKTPEEAGRADSVSADSEAIIEHEAPPKPKWYKLSWPPSRKQRIIGGALIVVLAFTIGAGWTLTHHKRAVVASGTPAKVKKVVPPKVIYSTLTGLPITDASLNSKPVTAVMIENSTDARPQSGLSDAGVVFEAVAEGGVTRFMALYQDTTPTNVGPIRSARPYYIQWALGFDAAYAHVGGSPDALADLTTWHVQNMDQFANGGSYHRITTRDAPHNVYTGIDTLNQLESTKGYSSSYTGFTRKKEAPSKAPNATSIDFGLSSYTYDPHYDYVAATNSYNRSEAGASQTDANTGKQLSPKVVIAIVVPESQGALDASGAYYSDYNPLGTGQAYIFQDGTVTTGTWSKPSNTDQIGFTDAGGKALPLNPGQTWITAVTAVNKVNYK